MAPGSVMQNTITLIVGLLVGAAVALVVSLLLRRREQQTAERLLAAAQEQRAAELGALIEQIKTHFAALSRAALSANADDFLKLARTQLEQQAAAGTQSLEGKKKLIDAQIETIGKRLAEMTQTLQTQENQRRESHGALHAQVEKATQVTGQLQATTEHLRQALANPQRRGQWGERIAEDVLRLAGFVEGVSYVKQTQLVDGTRPDFTFPLPNQQHVNMDVKFPIANYLKMLDAGEPAAQESLTGAFLKDVRNRIREVTTRDYIDPSHGTVDYVLVFIPNEQIHGFIHEHDPALLDDALRSKVVLCSPLTLYAVLAVMRQVAESFRLQQASQEILALFAAFRKQWDKYADVADKVGKKLDEAQAAFRELTTTRAKQLERHLDRIDALREAREVEPSAPLLTDADTGTA
jgi:DNA recombination protein RmuC